ncbi:hypothetical protein CHLRE_05g233052v5 [Chlamydomonas reinhardtii]|uniref:Uncharacterized protein n=1 Tax=Chlamydomonas reinhardtii TaxID=3055 RepID=A0A2K3DRU8_CHLRE|nr:uncharacterized protein CHLRE_05g233052v5 [Chlamydomonas reinhardtii]PNW83266.1 hypothetical protein CHLRE_05g233052v5 [Chlamydomonas reinhardtii]
MPATWHDMFRAAAAAAAGADTVLLQLLRERHGAAAAAAADTVLWRLLRERWRTWRDDVPGGGGGWRRCGGAGVGTGGACGRRMRAAARRRGIRPCASTRSRCGPQARQPSRRPVVAVQRAVWAAAAPRPACSRRTAAAAYCCRGSRRNSTPRAD